MNRLRDGRTFCFGFKFLLLASPTLQGGNASEVFVSSVEHSSKLNQAIVGCVSDMEATYAEYDEWSDSGVAETVARLYKKALQQLEKYKPLEETLVNTFCSFHKVHVQ